MPWDFVLILIVLGVLVPWRGAVRIKKLLSRERLSTADRLVLYASTIAFQWLAVAVVAWRCHARGLNAQRLALVYSDPLLIIITTAALSFFLGATQIFSLRRLARSPAHRQRHLPHLAQLVMPHNLIEALAFVALVSTVALCEEYLYRGFAFAALQDAAGGSLFLAALGSSTLFALGHLYQGRRGLRTTFIVGTLFAGARIATASLVPSIAAHLVTDLAAGLAGPGILRTPPAPPDAIPPTPSSAGTHLDL
jgi:membrane protease YdiL (CAAX protease family)